MAFSDKTSFKSRVMAGSPAEAGKRIEMFSPAYYAACTAGGVLSCGLTHTAVTPLDLVKCNMQVCFKLSHHIMLYGICESKGSTLSYLVWCHRSTRQSTKAYRRVSES
jgi:hypothetical protein